MKNDDLMDALSGLDPKYIDEAAFELHGKPQAKQKDKLFTLKRSLYIAIPAAAVIFLTLLLYPAVRNINSAKSAANEASSEAADAAYEEAAQPMEAAGESITSEETANEDAASDTADLAFEEEAAEAPAKAGEMPSDATYDAAPAAEAGTNAAVEASGEMPADAAYDAAADSESLTIPQNAEKQALDRGKTALINKASYDKGILTVTLSAPLTADPAKITYSISGMNTDGSYKSYAAGKLEDIMTSKDPLTLDISSLSLAKGTYYLTLAGEKAEFTVF